MALRITLEPGKKIIVNGAVIENTGGSATLKIHNKANILRGNDVMTEKEANTPARRLYHALQSAYLFEGNRGEYLERFRQFVTDYVAAAPSARDIADKTLNLVAAGDYYGALKSARKLLGHEEARLRSMAPAPRPKVLSARAM
ncbi:MAG TPA: flagellar biosynthesis repressor FlbT [Stellaceae bacterium]|nr:flagellar biosynthesis repressor FlbT [Stellaceae bacterium]